MMSAASPVLSIIVTAHNSGEFLDWALHSLLTSLGNSISQCEIILINDASTDNSGSLLMAFAQRIEQAKCYELHYENIGKVRHFAVTQCHGDYITMLDGDDLLKPASLIDVVQFLSQHKPDLLLTTLHEVRDITPEVKTWSGFTPKKISCDQTIRKFLIHKELQAHLIGQFIKRDFLERYPIPEFVCYEDFFVFPEIITHADDIFLATDSPYVYIKRPTSLSSTMTMEKLNILLLCTKKMESIVDKKYHRLLLCHWFDIYFKHKKLVMQCADLPLILSKIKEMYSVKTFLDLTIRMSYKRKLVELLWKK